MFGNRLHRCLKTALWLIGLAAVAAVFLMNIAYLTQVSYDAYERVTISMSIVPGICILLLLGGLTLLFSRCTALLSRIDERKLFFLLCGIYAVFAAYVILHVDDALRADAKIVFETARAVSQGDYAAFGRSGYLHRYPHQIGTMLFDQFLQRFWDTPRVNFVCNFLLILGINGVCWRISDRLFRDKLVNVLTLLICFAFLPQFFFLLFAYGLIPGMFFLMLGFYLLLRYLASYSIGSLIGMALSIGASIVLKKNFLIGGVAMVIVLLLHLLKTRRLQLLCGVAAAALCLVLPMRLITVYYEQKADADLSSPCPSVLWLAMGTDMNNVNLRGPGWYDDTNKQIYIGADYDGEAAAVIGMEKLRDNIEMMVSRPVWAASFLLKKNISQWCDPLYQSIWSGPLEACTQYTHTPLLQSIFDDGAAEDGIMWFAKLLSIALWGFSLLYLLLHGRKSEGWEVFFLYFIGGLIFHTFWEAKSQYTYSYAFCLIPFAMYAAADVLRWIEARWQKKTEKPECE